MFIGSSDLLGHTYIPRTQRTPQTIKHGATGLCTPPCPGPPHLLKLLGFVLVSSLEEVEQDDVTEYSALWEIGWLRGVGKVMSRWDESRWSEQVGCEQVCGSMLVAVSGM